MNQDRWPGCHDKPSWKCTKDQMTSQKLQSRPDSSMTRTVEKQKIIKFPSAPTQNFWLRKQIQRWYWMTELFFSFYFMTEFWFWSHIQEFNSNPSPPFLLFLGPHPAVLRRMPASAFRFTLGGGQGTRWGARDWTWAGSVQDKYLTHQLHYGSGPCIQSLF